MATKNSVTHLPCSGFAWAWVCLGLCRTKLKLNKFAQALTTHRTEKYEIVKRKFKIWSMINNTVTITKQKKSQMVLTLHFTLLFGPTFFLDSTH